MIFFLVVSSYALGIRVILASYNKFESVLSSLIFWKSLKMVDIDSFLNW